MLLPSEYANNLKPRYIDVEKVRPVSVKLPERSDGADVVCSYLSGN